MLRITKTFLLAAALLITGTAVKAQSNNNADTAFTTSNYPLQGFNSLRLQGPFNVYINIGATEQVKIDAPAEILDDIVAEVNHGELNIHNKHSNWLKNGGRAWYSDKNWWNKGDHPRVSVYITAKSLEGISVSGSGKVIVKDVLTANDFDLTLHGSGKIETKINAATLHSVMSGSGNITVSGNAGSSTIRISGSGRFSGHDLVTENSTVHVSGSGHADVNASDKVSASVSGSARISYAGNPKSISTSKSGSGAISRM